MVLQKKPIDHYDETAKEAQKPAAQEATVVPRKYHVQLVDSERTISASDIEITGSGILLFLNKTGGVKIAFPSGHWKYVETETQDD